MSVDGGTTSDLVLRVFVDDIPLLPKFANQIRRVEVESQINLPSACEIEFLDPDLTIPLECGLEIGNLVEIRAVTGDDAAGEAIFIGQVETLEIQFENTGGKLSVVRAYDASHRLLHGQKTMGYPMMTYSEVAEAIGLEHAIVTEAVPHPVVHEMVVQANETYWDFLVRLAKEIGYVVNIAVNPLTGTPTLHFGPTTPAETAPPPVGIDPLPLSFSIGDERIINLEASVSGSGITAASSARGWNQSLGLPSLGEAPTVSDTSVNAVMPEELGAELGGANQFIRLQSLASNEAATESASEGLAARLSGAYANIEIEMRGNPSIMPNRPISLANAGMLTGEYTITSSTHTFVPTLNGYRTSIVCSGLEDRTLAGLQDAAVVTSKLTGVYSAIVTDTEDPEAMGRVLLSFPWLSESYVSPWARVVQSGAGEGLGWQIIPEPTDEVLVAFENGQLNSPYVIGGLYSQDRRGGIPFAEVVEGAPMIRAFTSRDGHQLIFNDSPENTSLTVQTTFGASCKVRLSPETGIEIMTIEEQPIVITSASDVTVNSEGTVLVNAAEVTINGEGDVSVSAEGALELTAAGELSLAGTSVNVEASGDISLIAPAIDVSGGIVNLGA
ncbi:MAG: VgrG-related protein [Actinomycetota bacterium]|nr:VgrG-related protein [Actinomycetota bacterium]